jgi:hypothetical protein
VSPCAQFILGGAAIYLAGCVLLWALLAWRWRREPRPTDPAAPGRRKDESDE